MTTRLTTLFFLSFFWACQSPTTESSHTNTENTISKTVQLPTIGALKKLDAAFDNIIAPDAKIEVLGDGYDWSEGPVWLPKEKILLWSDVPQNVIYQWKEGEKAREYLRPSGYTGEGKREGSNGLLLNAAGELILCQHGDRRVAKLNTPFDAPQPNYETLADQYEGKRFNSPNDAAYDQDGYLYFTDPPYGLPKQMDDPEKEIPFQGVYRLSPDGTVTLLTDELSRPNGIAFSPDFSKCYVANSDPERAIWMVYDMTPEKTFANGRVFFDATDMVADNKGLLDGLKVRKDGTLFATGPGGVLVFSPEGQHLGTISTGEATANCCFNGEENVLFVTADWYVARVALKKE